MRLHACPGAALSFDRPVPLTLEPEVRASERLNLLWRVLLTPSQFLANHAHQFNRLQSMSFAPQAARAAGESNESLASRPPPPLVSRFTPPLASFFVATVPNGFVEGAAGAVFDSQRRLYAPAGTFAVGVEPPAGPDPALDGTVRAYPLLATVIQTYGWMYHHWVVETLPKLVLLRDALPALNASSLRLLLWGQPWEGEWLDILRLPREAVVRFDVRARYHATTLLLPSPVPLITPSAEALHAAREAVLARVQPSGPRDVLVVTSRAGERARAVANERELLQALRSAFPALRVEVHSRELSAAASVLLFSRAVAVVGPHGAGLSHVLFCSPGTVVVELMFMHSPPMMFWHMSAALGLRYAMAPLPRSFWGQQSKRVDAAEVVTLLRLALTGVREEAATGCAPGSYGAPCAPCLPGRVAPEAGSSFCTTCPNGTRSVDGVRCEACAAGEMAALVGNAEVCIVPPESDAELAAMLDEGREWAVKGGLARGAERVEERVERRLFEMHGGRVYGVGGGAEGLASPPPPGARSPPPPPPPRSMVQVPPLPPPPLPPQPPAVAAGVPSAAPSQFGWRASSGAVAGVIVVLVVLGAGCGYCVGARERRREKKGERCCSV